MKNDIQIQKDVIAQLNWEPILNAAAIGVSVKDGVVTLTGIVDTYTKKMAAERATKKVFGVKAVAEDVQVGVSPLFKRTDTEIAEAVLNALKWHTMVREDKIKIKVEKGVVTLEGDVEWEFQRSAVKSAIENLAGVKMIYNFIAVTPSVSAFDLKSKIRAALQRSALIDAENITVDVAGSTAVLRGNVHSISEKEDVESAVWLSPGVNIVDNQLQVSHRELAF